MKVVCAPPGTDVPGDADLRYTMYDRGSDKTVGSVGTSIRSKIKRLNIHPVPRAWDFLSVALAVVAADEGCSREASSDGWSREIELTVAVSDVGFWESAATDFESPLCFPTTDRWKLSFVPGKDIAVGGKEVPERAEQAICLLSGGLDSLVGALNLQADQKSLLLVSQVAKGDSQLQQELARIIGGDNVHLQLNHNASPPPGFSDRTQRSRSLIFIAYAILAATALRRYSDGECVEIFIPENGFISLNIPLTPLRLASHSTRTTHPFYIAKIQRLLKLADLNVTLRNPYQFRTKGEMLAECANPDALKRFAGQTTSCGRYARYGFQHCGRCVPCLIRRAAFQSSGITDTTPFYRFDNIGMPGKRHRDFDDVRSVAMAIEGVRANGIDTWIGGALNTAQLGDITLYRETASRGLEELSAFMAAGGAI